MRIRNPPWILLCDVGPVPGLNDPDAIIPRADGFISPDAATNAADSPTPAEASLQQEAQQQSYGSKARKDPTPHLSYIRNLQRKQPSQTILERFGAGYQDYLQGPLQPLSDNLESITYEVFEKDPVKYDLYERAIRLALTDWVAAGHPGSSHSGAIVVTVVGAGRGPLVTRALRAAEDASVHIELWAVEKNPNAYVLLQRHNEAEWNNQVHLVQSDMRCWSGPCTPAPKFQPSTQQQQTKRYKVDILISELLGSFADNELSPECLDPLIHNLLNPAHGLSIPNSYTSYLTPIAAPKLHTDILARAAAGDAQAHNTPYVVMLHAVDFLSFPSSTTNLSPIVLPAWSFHNRRPLSATSSFSDTEKGEENQPNNKHNTRAAHISFPLPHRGTMHGLAGYFEASLYGPVILSTHPGTMEAHSAGMMSWFPIFFPLKVRRLALPPLSLPRDLLKTIFYSLGAPLLPDFQHPDGTHVPVHRRPQSLVRVDGGIVPRRQQRRAQREAEAGVQRGGKFERRRLSDVREKEGSLRPDQPGYSQNPHFSH